MTASEKLSNAQQRLQDTAARLDDLKGRLAALEFENQAAIQAAARGDGEYAEQDRQANREARARLSMALEDAETEQQAIEAHIQELEQAAHAERAVQLTDQLDSAGEAALQSYIRFSERLNEALAEFGELLRLKNKFEDTGRRHAKALQMGGPINRSPQPFPIRLDVLSEELTHRLRHHNRREGEFDPALFLADDKTKIRVSREIQNAEKAKSEAAA